MVRHRELATRENIDPRWLNTPVPTWTTVFFRIFLPWQMLRFAAINLKMMGIIAASHRQEH